MTSFQKKDHTTSVDEVKATTEEAEASGLNRKDKTHE
jgi:hypothetical protein